MRTSRSKPSPATHESAMKSWSGGQIKDNPTERRVAGWMTVGVALGTLLLCWWMGK